MEKCSSEPNLLVLSTDGRVEVDAPSAFDVRYSLSLAEDDVRPLADAAARADGGLTVDVPGGGMPSPGCRTDALGDLTGRFVSLLQTSDE